MVHDEQDIVDRIYEAAVIPELWPDLLDRFSGMVRGNGGVIFAHSIHGERWLATPEAARIFTRWLEAGWKERNARVGRAMAIEDSRFVTEADLFRPDEIETEPMLAWLRENGAGWSVGTLIRPPSGDVLVFNIERPHDWGPFGDQEKTLLERFRPALARAAMMAARLGLERARAMTHAMALIGLPAAALTEAGRIVHANPLFEERMPAVFRDGLRRVGLADPRADEQLREALQAVRGQATSIALRATDEFPGGVLHLLPVRRSARDLFVGAESCLILTELGALSPPGIAILQGLFDLTPAEAGVARRLALGLSLAEIAAETKTSDWTVRSHVKAIFGKLGVGRQVDVVRLLQSLGAR